MNIPLRKILRVLYPARFSAAQGRTPGRRFSMRRLLFNFLLVLFVLKGMFLLFYYNTFLSLQYDVEESTAQIDTQLQRRKNVILNLSLMVRDYARHERAIFEHTTDTRKEMLGAGSGSSPTNGPPSREVPARPAADAPEGLSASGQDPAGDLEALLAKARMSDGELDALLSRVFAIAERYPDLRLSESFQVFMDALVDAENKIAEQRMVYNQRANLLSTAIGKFPGFLFARIYGFEPPPFFEPEDDAREPPRVEDLTS